MKTFAAFALLLLASCPRIGLSQTSTLFNQTLAVPNFGVGIAFTVPAADTGTLWLGTAPSGPTSTMVNGTGFLFLNGVVSQVLTLTGNTLPYVKSYALSPGSYVLEYGFYATNGATNDTVLFEANLGLSPQVAPTPPPAPAPAPTPAPTPTVTITVTPTSTAPISPYIYGLNGLYSAPGSYSVPGAAPKGITLDRFGGDLLTAYNWQTNATNAGKDYNYYNYNYLSTSTVPGQAATGQIAQDQAAGVASLFTIQLQGYVAADESGPVPVTNPITASRFKTVQYAKGSAFTTTPSNSNPSVYDDEFVWNVAQKFPGTLASGAKIPLFVELDNEPDLWSSTHPEIQPSAVPAATLIANTAALAKAIKAQFPGAKLFGPVNYGFLGLYNFQSDPTINASASGYNWFVDEYAKALAGLVDVYDFHWYSSATDGSGNTITNLNGSSLTAAQVQAIVQSPRSLWDPTYVENSWITADMLGNGPIELLPRLWGKLANAKASMGLAITEYYNGGAEHIAGTIAQADNLGIFGAQGLTAATFWPLTTPPYVLAGFSAYRNFDGAGSNFGDTSVAAVSSNTSEVAAYASTDSTRPGRVVFVAINRSTASQVVALSGEPLSGTAHLWQMTASSAAGQSPIVPVSVGTQPVSGTSLTVTLPALSVTTIDCY